MHRSYVEPAWIEAWLKDPKYRLPPEASRRFVEIVRIKTQEKIALFDGQGRQITGLLAHDKSSNLYYLEEAKLIKVSPATPQIILAQAAITESKIAETLRRGCEFGVDKFIIFNAQKSESFCLNKLKKRSARLEAILLDAARQSERLLTPNLIFTEDLKNYLRPQGVFGDLGSDIKLSEILKQKYDSQKDFLIVIGPEGGLTPGEIENLQKAHLTGVRWGPYTQRSELAGLAAVSIFNAFCGRA